MLAKLMKYDLKSLLKGVLPIYLIGIVLAIVSRLFDVLVDHLSFLSITAGFMLFFFILAMIAIPFFTLGIVVMKYYNTMVKDEAYLTHTLPVKKSTLVLSKIIDGFILMVISTIVIILCIAIRLFMIDGVFTALKEVWLSSVEVLGLSFWIIIIVAFFLGFISFFTCVFAAISFGQKHNNNKFIMSFVYYIAIYYINQIVSVVLLIVPVYLNKSWWNTLNSENVSIEFINGYLLVALVISLVMSAVYYFITVNNMTKKLNLE